MCAEAKAALIVEIGGLVIVEHQRACSGPPGLCTTKPVWSASPSRTGARGNCRDACAELGVDMAIGVERGDEFVTMTREPSGNCLERARLSLMRLNVCGKVSRLCLHRRVKPNSRHHGRIWWRCILIWISLSAFCLGAIFEDAMTESSHPR